MKNKNDFFQDRKGNKVLLTGLQCHNSSSSTDMIDITISAIKKHGGNLLEAPVYWSSVEPIENVYKFDDVKELIDKAKEANLFLIPLWFGFSKNGLSTYSPEYVKTNPSVYKLAENAAGIAVESLTANCEETLDRDKKAFLKFIQFVEKYDRDGTVIAIQVENEVGLVGTDRDYSAKSTMQFNNEVPEIIRDKHNVQKNNWKDVFGRHANEAFTAWQFASYIQELASEAKEIFEIPYIINISIEVNGYEEPGHSYISGGPVSRVIDIYKKIAKDIYLYGPDIYLAAERDFRKACDAYNSEDNPLFIPESLHGGVGPAMNLLIAVAEYNAIGVCAFGAESGIYNDELTEEAEYVASSMRMISSLSPILIKNRGTGNVHAITQQEFSTWQYIKTSDYHIVVSFINNPNKPQHYFGSRINLNVSENENYINERGRGILVDCGEGEFYISGAGLCLEFTRIPNANEEKPYAFIQSNISSQLHFLTIEEGHFDGDRWVCEYRRNGDEANYQLYVHKGQTIRVRLNTAI
ncbi:MAG: DUF5597 domain-containing protein [Suipraeoptans sp.]